VTESPPLSSLLNDVRAILQEARGKAYAAANTAMVEPIGASVFALLRRSFRLSWSGGIFSIGRNQKGGNNFILIDSV
jgi:hypothetical protein